MKKPLATLGALGLARRALGALRGRLGSAALAPSAGRRACPTELDGLRVVHLSDFHLGFPVARRARRRPRDRWTAARDPDLVVITGDLLSRPSAERRLRELLERVPGSFAVLGNHDFAIVPRPVLEAERGHRARLDDGALVDEARTVELRGRTRADRRRRPAHLPARNGLAPGRLADPDADLASCSATSRA